MALKNLPIRHGLVRKSYSKCSIVSLFPQIFCSVGQGVIAATYANVTSATARLGGATPYLEPID